MFVYLRLILAHHILESCFRSSNRPSILQFQIHGQSEPGFFQNTRSRRADSGKHPVVDGELIPQSPCISANLPIQLTHGKNAIAQFLTRCQNFLPRPLIGSQNILQGRTLTVIFLMFVAYLIDNFRNIQKLNLLLQK